MHWCLWKYRVFFTFSRDVRYLEREHGVRQIEAAGDYSRKSILMEPEQ